MASVLWDLRVELNESKLLQYLKENMFTPGHQAVNCILQASLSNELSTKIVKLQNPGLGVLARRWGSNDYITYKQST